MLVEGQTERAVVQSVLAPELGAKGVYVYSRVVGRPGHKGGNRFAVVLQELTMLLSQEPESTVTMLFDYYGLGKDWPDLEKSGRQEFQERSDIVESAIVEAVAGKMGPDFNRRRFIPYIQLHEIETLFFAGPREMAQVFKRPGLESEFTRIVEHCGGCERINSHPETAPSKRILELFPAYRKGDGVNAHAPLIIRHIGLPRIRKLCPHFNEWLSRLEQLT